MIATVLRQQPKDGRSCIAAWRQLSDILAQRGNQLGELDVRRALHALAILRPRVPESDRRATAASIAKHGRFAPLVAFYASDVPAVATTMLRQARLAEDDWLALLPATSPVARSLLAQRDDLPSAVKRALASLGSRSVALPHPNGAASARTGADHSFQDEVARADGASSQISELVRRIDKYRAGKPEVSAPVERDSFTFETGPDGVVHWADGVARGSIIGLSIAEAAFGREPGTDGIAVGAFRQRAEIINARLRIAGNDNGGGEWRFSALPWFDCASGQFRGYRGTARRPHRNEIPYGSPTSSDAGDSIRQLLHELRSPLNAISGFAQIIANQMFGPVSHAYRQMAESIVSDAANVQSIIEDLETTARGGDGPQPEVMNEVSDLSLIAQQVENDIAPILASNGARLRLARGDGPFAVRVGAKGVRRMVGRLLTAIVDIAAHSEEIDGEIIVDQTATGQLILRISRPRAIHTDSESALLDPGYSPSGDAPGAAILSLGFSLRLVASLAQSAGGRLEIGHNSLTLHLPSATSVTLANRNANGGD